MKPAGSRYINAQRRDYSLYVMQNRAIPSVTDGLRASGRRVLWTARDGKKVKCATLAGATMPIHPHGSPDDVICTLAAPYGNNIPLFKGDGAFGTLLNPKAYGATRYTSVTTSAFTQDVIFRDIEIIPMQDNYDSSLQEPVHFLPLVPTVLLNPSDGIAVGFATKILPRSLSDIIKAQISHLKGENKKHPLLPKFTPIDSEAVKQELVGDKTAYYFNGQFERVNSTTIRITKLPYGQSHDDITKEIAKLYDADLLVNDVDDSKRSIDILLKFKRGVISEMSDQDIMSMLKLSGRQIENLNVLDFSGKFVWNTTPQELVQRFTDWRLSWYKTRYQRLADLQQHDLQRFYDIRIAIKNNISAVARKVENRSELRELLATLDIINIDYIADLPIYRFTEEERLKNEQRIIDGEKQLKYYKSLIDSKKLCTEIYIEELQQILTKYNKGAY